MPYGQDMNAQRNAITQALMGIRNPPPGGMGGGMFGPALPPGGGVSPMGGSISDSLGPPMASPGYGRGGMPMWGGQGARPGGMPPLGGVDMMRGQSGPPTGPPIWGGGAIGRGMGMPQQMPPQMPPDPNLVNPQRPQIGPAIPPGPPQQQDPNLTYGGMGQSSGIW